MFILTKHLLVNILSQAVHKIQSSEPLRLHFELVPKVLRPLVKFWVPDAFVISFKVTNQFGVAYIRI